MPTRLRTCAAVLTLVAVIAPTRPAAASASCQRDAGWAETKSTWAGEVLALTNAHRATLGLGPLAPSASLMDAATWKAAHMAGFEYMAHDDPAPPIDRSWDQRIRDCGYSSGAGENIAYGYRTPQAVFQGWLDSAGHRQNIENPTYKVIGVGAAVTDGGTPYWAQIFGTRVQLADGIDLPDPLPSAPPPATEPPPPPPADHGSALVTRDDAASVAEDGTLRVSPLDNDTGASALTSVGYPAHGTARVDGTTVVYAPDRDFNGTDSFTYSVSGEQATVTVTVEPRNDAPRAAGDAAKTRPRRVVVVPVVSNDSDVDGDALELRSVLGAPYFGTVTVDRERGTISYRPRRGTAGRVDRIRYEVSDGHGGVAVGTADVRIRR